MKIKMYTKGMCFPFEGAPYEKTMCVVYDSIDDINMIDGKDISRFGDTDGDTPLRKPVVYPYLVQDSMLFAKKMLGDTWSETIGKYSNMIAKTVSRKLNLSDLTHEWLRLDYDGVSTAEENAFKWIYGPKEKRWRSQREFFAFVADHDNVEKSALISAAHAVVEAMQLAREDEEIVERYRKTYICPAILKHLRK